MTKIQQIQKVLGVVTDGIWGPKTQLAFDLLFRHEWIKVTASSFADPGDLKSFWKCKSKGGTDKECFKVGDNGIGFTGVNCADLNTCICALPREVWLEKWGTAGTASGQRVEVRYHDEVYVGIMGDTMPAQRYIRNKAGIDLNPGFQRVMNVAPPFMVPVEWRWAS